MHNVWKKSVVNTLISGLISTISGVSQNSGGLGQKSIMWRFAVWLLFLHIFCSTPVSATEASCPPWGTTSEADITGTVIPQDLKHILEHHKGKGLVAKFEEEKKIRILQRPLRSSGELIYLPDKGLYRRLTAPFKQELLITRTHLQQRDHHGRIEILTLDQLPLAKAIVDGLLMVFSGSLEAAQANFEGYFSSVNHHWKLGLKPRHSTMAQIISCLLIEGENEHALRLLIHEANGDLTVDQFIESQILTPEQWKDYRLQFEWGN
jgi:hypothetical protein